tara:strand:- start:298 stop:555 length:258 start_codon:yes stop_codon:yes gene_type:complete
MTKKYSKISPKALGISFGIVWGFALGLFTLISAATGMWESKLAFMVGIYPGYAISLIGSIFGLIFGFIDGFIGGWLIAWVYNKIA